MTQVSQTRTYDPSKDLETKSGKELKGFIEAAIASDETALRVLKRGISFNDNFNCEVRTVDLKHEVAATFKVSNDKRVDMVLCGKVSSTENYLAKPLHWYYAENGDFTVFASFNSATPVAISVKIVILFS